MGWPFFGIKDPLRKRRRDSRRPNYRGRSYAHCTDSDWAFGAVGVNKAARGWARCCCPSEIRESSDLE